MARARPGRGVNGNTSQYATEALQRVQNVGIRVVIFKNSHPGFSIGGLILVHRWGPPASTTSRCTPPSCRATHSGVLRRVRIHLGLHRQGEHRQRHRGLELRGDPQCGPTPHASARRAPPLRSGPMASRGAGAQRHGRHRTSRRSPRPADRTRCSTRRSGAASASSPVRRTWRRRFRWASAAPTSDQNGARRMPGQRLALRCLRGLANRATFHKDAKPNGRVRSTCAGP